MTTPIKPKLVVRIKDPRRFLVNKQEQEQKQEDWLTDGEYEFLLDDIENARIEGNEKYGYGGVDVRKSRRQKRWEQRTTVQKVAIAKGIIKIHQPQVPAPASSREVRHQ